MSRRLYLNFLVCADELACNPTCGTSGCMSSSVCCPVECYGGCSPLGKCLACADGFVYNELGHCVEDCGTLVKTGQINAPLEECVKTQSLFEQVTLRTDTFYCVADCPTGLSKHENLCTVYCPDDADAVAGVCTSQGLPGIYLLFPVNCFNLVVCESTFDITNICQVTSIIRESCGMLRGSFKAFGNSQLLANGVSQFKGLAKLKRIAGYFHVEGSTWTELSAFAALEQIDGTEVWMLSDTSMTSDSYLQVTQWSSRITRFCDL